MRELFRLFSLRRMRLSRLRALLGLSSIALGVALYVSSEVATTSASASMRESARGLAGAAQWQVTRGRSLGVEESLLPRIRQIPGVIAAPVIQASVALRQPRGGTLLLLGVDFQSDSMLRLYRFSDQGRRPAALGAFAAAAFTPGGIVVSRQFAERHRLGTGARVLARTREGVKALTITGLLEDEGPARAFSGGFGIMELHAAQNLFGRSGFVDRIEVAGATREELARVCGPGYDVAPAARVNSMAEDALARIHSLVAISVVALLVGLFIIYNSVQISIVERLKEIGTLRALGATRRQVMLMHLAEWLAVGLAGSALGVLFGYGLAKGLLAYTSRTLNALIPLIDVRHLSLSGGTAATGVVLGTSAALAAAFIPALGATRAPVLELLRPRSYRLVHRYPWALAIGLAIGVLGAGLMGIIPRSPTAGLAATALVFVGLAMVLPQVILTAARAARPALQRLFRLEGYLAADSIVKFPQRSALTSVTLGGALSMMVATAALVGGFASATASWIRAALPFDLAIMATDFRSSIYSQQCVPGSLLQEVRHVPGVAMTYGVRIAFADFRAQDIMVVGLETRPFLQMHQNRGMSAWARALAEPAVADRFRSGEGIYVSENFAALFNVQAGSWLDLSTPSGRRRFQVLRAIEDYSWPRGAILLDLDTLRRLWQDDTLTYVDVAVAPGAAREEVRTRLADRLAGQYGVFVYDREQIQRVSEDLLRQTVAVADLQVLIAILIGFIGIVNSLLISVLQRTREIGLLRAVGMTRGQLAETVILEGVFVALAGGAIGVVGGLVGGWIPLRLFTFAMTGYLFPLIVPWRQAGLAIAVALLVGVVASLVPARRAAGLPVLEAIGYE